MTKKTVTYQHPVGQDRKAEDAPDCIQQQTIFEVQWTNCPLEVEEDVTRLWQEYQLPNDVGYLQYDRDEFIEGYPVLVAYLDSRDVTECLIHWWW